MKIQHLLPLLLIGLLTSCKFLGMGPANYLPSELKDVQWESTAAVIGESHNLELAHERNFRTVYIEKVEDNADIDLVVYYFANIEGRADQPLYEVIIQYTSESRRDEVAEKLFGAPNTDDGEWTWTEDGADYRAWTFQKKLVVVKIVPGCEWDS